MAPSLRSRILILLVSLFGLWCDQHGFANCSELMRGTLPDPMDFTCGMDALTVKIFGGNAAELGEFPWFALLQYRLKNGTLMFNCGGSLINLRYILTAAHCVQDPRFNTEQTILVSVRLGEHNTATELDCIFPYTKQGCSHPPQNFGIEERLVHPGFHRNETHLLHDIALLRLDRDATITDFVKPICLPRENFTPTANNVNVTIVGFGYTAGLGRSNIIQKANIPIHSRNTHQRFWDIATLIEGQLFAGGMLSADACVGDSGGPLMTKRPYWVQEGIVSYGYTKNCTVFDKPGVYTRVSAYVCWITETIRE